VRRAASNVLLPLVIAITTAIAATKHGPVRVYWCLGAFLALLVNGVISYTKDRNTRAIRDDAIRARTDSATALNDTGQPLVVALGNVTSAKTPADARQAIAVLLDRAVSLARSEVGRLSQCKTRAAFYSFEGDKLVRKIYYGWNGCTAPRKEFVSGHSDHDNEVIKFAEGEDALLVKDLENKPPAYFADCKGRCYKSFVSVPVRAGTKSYGLLTADADQPYALTEVDRGFLILIAGTLGAGLAHVDVVEGRG
jgi:putative methionine-R-sulfoxide reductase with GAF domain